MWTAKDAAKSELQNLCKSDPVWIFGRNFLLCPMDLSDFLEELLQSDVNVVNEHFLV